MAEGLTLDRVTIDKAETRLIDIDCTIPPGEALTIMGPSGSGKSTLLSWIIGALPPEFSAAGRILIDGADITRTPPPRRRIGILFQDDLLFPHLSVAGNLAFGLARSVPRAERARAIETALDEIGLAGFGPRDPATLSGGQKSRVALMRMLLSEPRALLLDEPFSRLDTDLRAQIRSFVLDRARDRKLPVLIVTHDIEDAKAAAGPIHRLG